MKKAEDHLSAFERVVLAIGCVLIVTMGLVSDGNWRLYLVRLTCGMVPTSLAGMGTS